MGLVEATEYVMVMTEIMKMYFKSSGMNRIVIVDKILFLLDNEEVMKDLSLASYFKVLCIKLHTVLVIQAALPNYIPTFTIADHLFADYKESLKNIEHVISCIEVDLLLSIYHDNHLSYEFARFIKPDNYISIGEGFSSEDNVYVANRPVLPGNFNSSREYFLLELEEFHKFKSIWTEDYDSIVKWGDRVDVLVAQVNFNQIW